MFAPGKRDIGKRDIHSLSAVMMRKLVLTVAALLSLSASQSDAAMTIRGYTGSSDVRYDRYANNASFIGANFNFFGVGHDASTHWATMISPSYFLTAFHAGASGTISFDVDNVPGGQLSYTTSSLTRVGATDLYVGKLTTPVVANITKYAIAVLPTVPDYIGKTMFVVGQGATDGSSTDVQDDRVGRNQIDQVGNATVSGTTGVATVWDYDLAGGTGDDETLTQGNDSGAPDFLDINGQLALVGIRWFRTSVSTQDASGSSFVPWYYSEIADIVWVGSDNTESVTFVAPEPASASVLLASSLALLARRRRA
jgi:hypothetical protein